MKSPPHPDDPAIRLNGFWSFVLWTIPAIISAFHAYRWDAVIGHPIGFAKAFAAEAPPWYVLALFSPSLLRFAVRHPLRWPPPVLLVLRHAAVFAGVSFAVVTTYTVSFQLQNRTVSLAGFLRLYPHIWTDCLPKVALAFIALYREAAATVHAIAARRAERQRAALSVQLAQAQIRAIESQLHPHFLFNTLDGVVALIREGNPERAAHAVILLSEMFRSILSWRARSRSQAGEPTGAGDSVALEQELDFVRRYVELAQMRFEDRLRVTWSIEPGLERARVLPLSLQPLVENAFRHGLEKRRHAGLLVVGARKVEDGLELFVEDDGPGPTESRDSEGRDRRRARPGAGIGLSSTRARLLEAYGEGASLLLAPRLGGGTRASIRLPDAASFAPLAPEE